MVSGGDGMTTTPAGKGNKVVIDQRLPT